MSLTDALLREAYPLDVWIALRTDGAQGSGTEDDPYNGSPRYEAVLAVSSLTRSGREAAANTAASHGYANGDIVTLSGVTGTGAQYYNGSFVIYSVTTNSFKYWMAGDPGASGTGSITCARTSYRFDEALPLIPANRTLHLGPGVFLTRGHRQGDTNSPLKSGQKIRGSGLAVTTVKLVNASVAGSKYAVIGNEASAGNLDSFEVSDLTVDCNLDGQLVAGQDFPPLSCAGIMASGAHLRYRRVRAINFGSLQSNNECFTLWAAGAAWVDGAMEAVDCVIEDCILEQPALNHAWTTTCIIMGAQERNGGPNPGLMAYHRGCVVRNCVVNCEYQDNPLAIESISVPSGGVSTVTTRLPHGLAAQQWIRINGAIVSGAPANGFDNGYNGSFQVITPNPGGNTRQFTYAPNNPLPTVAPASTSDLWVGRWPSHFIPINAPNGVTKSGSGPWTITVTTGTPHFLVPGSQVVVNNVFLDVQGQNPSKMNGVQKVTQVTNRKTFQYVMTTDPGTDQNLNLGGAIIGVPFVGASIDGGSEAVMEGCHILNCTYGGPYHDTWSSKDLIVRNNHYRAVFTGPYQYMGRVGQPIAAVSLTQVDPTNDPLLAQFVVNLTVPHGFTVGQGVHIKDATVNHGSTNNPYNGYFRVEGVSDTSFTYRMTDIPSGPAADPGTAKVEALWQVGQCVIENNVTEIIAAFNTYGPPGGPRFSGAPQDVLFNSIPGLPVRIFRRVVIRNNIIRLVDTVVQGAGSEQGISLNGCENVSLEHNVIDATILTPIAWVNCTNLRVFNNRTSAGQLIPVQGVSTLPDLSTVKQDDLSKVIEDATILAIL